MAKQWLEMNSKIAYRIRERDPDLPPDPPGIPASITFGDRDRAFMDEEVALVIEAVRNYPAFSGIAIHDYESFRDLSNGRTPHATQPIPNLSP